MNSVEPSQAFWYQRVAFYFALANFLALLAWSGARFYFASIGDSYGDRKFALDPNLLGMFPLWALNWIIACVIVGNSILESKRVTWYGIGTLVMLAVPAIPVTLMVIISYWRFAANL